MNRGHLEVSLLEQPAQQEDPLKNFQITDTVNNFSTACYNKNTRVKYASFITQKRGGPSKLFSVK